MSIHAFSIVYILVTCQVLCYIPTIWRVTKTVVRVVSVLHPNPCYTVREMARKRVPKHSHTTVTNSNSPSEKVKKVKRLRKARVTPRIRKVIEAMIENPDSTLKAAGMKAGFPEKSAASQARTALKSAGAQELFRRAMKKHKVLRDDGLATKLAEGMDATVTKFFAHEGQVVDERECVDFGARHSYLALATRLAGLDPGASGKIDVTTNGKDIVAAPTAAIAALASLNREELLALIAATDSGKSALKDMNPVLPQAEIEVAPELPPVDEPGEA